MFWCLGRSKKGYVWFFGGIPVSCLFSPEKKDIQENHTKKKQDINEYCLINSPGGHLCHVIMRFVKK